MNILRKSMAAQVEALREPLMRAYKAVARYQFDRTLEAEAQMRAAIGQVVPLLRPFGKLVPKYRGRYLKALDEACRHPAALSASDLLLLFDEAVYQMHVRLSPRENGAAAPIEPWSRALLDLLDGRRGWQGALEDDVAVR